jgi:hypothetical protein
MKSIKNPMWIRKPLEPSVYTEHTNKISQFVLRKMHDDLISKDSGKKSYFGYVEEDIITFYISLLLRKHNPMNRIFKIKIDQVISSGIMNKFFVGLFEVSAIVSRKQQEEEKQENPEKLTMEHLELCFYAVLIGLAMSCVVFVAELLIGSRSSRST